MTWFSISEYSRMTGRAIKTVRERLEELPHKMQGASKCYESKDALPLIYQIEGGATPAILDIQQRTRLNKARAEEVELRVKKLNGELVPTELVVEFYSERVAGARAKLLALPTRVANALPLAPTEKRTVQTLIDDEIFALLNELSEPIKPDLQESPEGMASATQTNGKSVGGKRKTSKPRGKRRVREVA